MIFTKSELEIIFQYAIGTKQETLDEMRKSIATGADDLTKAITENAMCKLGKIPEPECGGIIQDIKNNFHDKPGNSIYLKLEMEKINQSVLLGHNLSGAERFQENTRHMIIFDVLRNDSIVGCKGESYRCFISDKRYANARQSEQRGEIKIKSHAEVKDGKIYTDKGKKELAR